MRLVFSCYRSKIAQTSGQSGTNGTPQAIEEAEVEVAREQLDYHLPVIFQPSPTPPGPDSLNIIQIAQ